jgi:hypothetical protein
LEISKWRSQLRRQRRCSEPIRKEENQEKVVLAENSILKTGYVQLMAKVSEK